MHTYIRQIFLLPLFLNFRNQNFSSIELCTIFCTFLCDSCSLKHAFLLGFSYGILFGKR